MDASRTPEAADGKRGGTAGDEAARRLGAQTSDVVLQAASVLEEELSAGIGEARRLQGRLTDQGRLEARDLNELVTRVRRNAHQLVDAVSEGFEALSADDVQELRARLTKDVHEVLDAVLDLTALVPPTFNRVAERTEGTERTGETSGGPGKQPPSSAGPTDTP